MSHDAAWSRDDSRLTEKQKERGFEGYYCDICYQTVTVPPGGFPVAGKHSNP